LSIEVTGESEILDTKILQVSRTLTGITFSPLAGVLNKAAVAFEILESDDGAALQVTYAGPRDAELNFSGVTIGASQPTTKAPNGPYQTIARQLSPWLGTIDGLVRGLAAVSAFLVLALQIMALFPAAGRFVYRRIFRSKRTDDEIRSSLAKLTPYAAAVMMVVATYLVLAAPTSLQGQVPAPLIVSG